MPGQHVVDDAQVDVPGDRAALRPLEIHLGDPVVLEDRDALLADVDRDHKLALRGGSGARLRVCGVGAPPATAGARACRPTCLLVTLACFVRAGAVRARRRSLPRRRHRSRAVGGFFLPRPPRLPRRRLFFGPAGDSSAARLRRLLLCCLRLLQSLRRWCYLRGAVPRALPVLLAACQSETSVVPKCCSPRWSRAGPGGAIGSSGLALRGFKTTVDMT